MCGASSARWPARPAGGGEPARVAAHRFVHEDLRRGVGHRGDVERAFAHRDRGVLRRRTEARAAIGDRQVVVDRLRHADAGQRVAEFFGEPRDLEGRVGRIVAAVVEEPAHVVRLEHLQQALVARAVGFQRLELHAAGTERAARRVGEGADRRQRLFRGVDQLLAQRAEDPVARGQHLDLAGAGGRDDRRRGGVDDGGDAARLGVQQGSVGHGRFVGRGRVGVKCPTIRLRAWEWAGECSAAPCQRVAAHMEWL